MSEIVFPLTLVAFIANVGQFLDTLDVSYLPPVALSVYIFKVLASGDPI